MGSGQKRKVQIGVKAGVGVEAGGAGVEAGVEAGGEPEGLSSGGRSRGRSWRSRGRSWRSNGGSELRRQQLHPCCGLYRSTDAVPLKCRTQSLIELVNNRGHK
ncbi:hypothetical protein Droror1_Dr00020086 [Drosera rotundifolia]